MVPPFPPASRNAAAVDPDRVLREHEKCLKVEAWNGRQTKGRNMQRVNEIDKFGKVFDNFVLL